MQQNDWIYDWNVATPPQIPPGARGAREDETLRDGLQNPSVFNPSIEEKIEILYLMESLGIDSVNIGLPGAGPRAFADTEALAREIATHRMKIKPNCAARTHENDIRPIVEISQRVGVPIEAATFLGSSPIRRLVEDWTVDHLERTTEKAVKFAVDNGLPSMYVTEDTIRTDPATVKRLYSTAIRNGASAIVLCDTVGHATPNGAYNLVKFAIEEVVKPSGENIRVDWHGHNDRGLAIANSLAAVAAGAHQVHAAALIKAFRKNDLELANAVYSGVPAHLFGLDQVIEIGPLSGKSNVLFWLEKHHIPADDATVARIFDAAKQSQRVLSDAEVFALCTEAARN